MADIRRSMLELFQQGMDTVTRVTTKVTDATRSKLDELSLQNQRKELMTAISSAVYELWQKGVDVPEELEALLKQIRHIDDELAAFAKQAEKPQEADGTSVPAEQQEAVNEPVQEQPADDQVPTIDIEQQKTSAQSWAPFQSEVPSLRVDDPEEKPSEE